MRPFTIEKDPETGKDLKIPWPLKESNITLGCIRANVIRLLSERDCRIARERGFDKQVMLSKNRGHEVLCTVEIVEDEKAPKAGELPARLGSIEQPNAGKIARIHQEARAIKHSTREFHDTLHEAWAEFCSEPRSYEGVEVQDTYEPQFEPRPGDETPGIDISDAIPEEYRVDAVTQTVPTAQPATGFVPFKCAALPDGRPVEELAPEQPPKPGRPPGSKNRRRSGPRAGGLTPRSNGK